MKFIIFIIFLLFTFDLPALPFNDDMVHMQPNAGQITRPRPDGSIPKGSLDYIKVKNKEEAENLKNPIPADKYSIMRGERLFSANCTACHGNITPGTHEIYPAGKYLGSPNLADPLYHDRTDGNIYGTIHFGNVIMPAVGWKISAEETWDIINYVRSVQEKAKE